MYDALTTTYRLSCPHRGETAVPLSRFRRLDELPGPHHPAVYQVEFSCRCGELHPGLVAQDDLDWAPLGLAAQTPFLNLMTSRHEPLACELSELAAEHIKAGEWPWSFFCWPEQRPRAAYPSSFWLIGPGARGEGVLVAVRCPVCALVSVNHVSPAHVDVPFHNDRDVGVLTRHFDAAARGDGRPLLEPDGAGFELRRLGA